MNHGVTVSPRGVKFQFSVVVGMKKLLLMTLTLFLGLILVVGTPSPRRTSWPTRREQSAFPFRGISVIVGLRVVTSVIQITGDRPFKIVLFLVKFQTRLYPGRPNTVHLWRFRLTPLR